MSSRALVGSTKYVVVSHSVTSCSAVLNTNVNRVLHVCTGDGRVIVGGTISIPNGSTVSVNTTVDEYGGGVASGSTVSISGGTPTFAGKNIIGGTLLLGENATLTNGTEIIGVGSGATISTRDGTASSIFNASASTISNCIVTEDKYIAAITYATKSAHCTIKNCQLVRGTNGGGCDVVGCTITSILVNNGDRMRHMFKNCILTRDFAYTTISNSKANIVFDGCTMTGDTPSVIMNLNNTGTIVFMGNNIIKNFAMSSGNSPGTTHTIYIVAGSTINMQGSTRTSAQIFGTATPGVKVGTFSNLTTEVDSALWVWTTGGSATIITASGSTLHVWGEGTSIDKDGNTDLQHD